MSTVEYLRNDKVINMKEIPSSLASQAVAKTFLEGIVDTRGGKCPWWTGAGGDILLEKHDHNPYYT